MDDEPLRLARVRRGSLRAARRRRLPACESATDARGLPALTARKVEAVAGRPLFGGYSFTVPRPPTEGSYTIVYTDEGGHQTTVVVPAPARDLTITSPAADAQLPIPLPGAQLVARYTIPFPATSPLSQPRFSTDVFVGVEGPCKAGRSDGTPASAPSCINIGSAQQAPTGSAVISDTGVAPGFGHGFDNLAAGPGEMYVNMSVAGDLPSSGFASVHVSFDDVASIPITWVLDMPCVQYSRPTRSLLNLRRDICLLFARKYSIIAGCTI